MALCIRTTNGVEIRFALWSRSTKGLGIRFALCRGATRREQPAPGVSTATVPYPRSTADLAARFRGDPSARSRVLGERPRGTDRDLGGRRLARPGASSRVRHRLGRPRRNLSRRDDWKRHGGVARHPSPGCSFARRESAEARLTGSASASASVRAHADAGSPPARVIETTAATVAVSSLEGVEAACRASTLSPAVPWPARPRRRP